MQKRCEDIPAKQKLFTTKKYFGKIIESILNGQITDYMTATILVST